MADPAVPTAPTDAPLMSVEDASAWRARIAASRQFIKPIIAQGQKNVNRQRQKFFDAPSSVDRIAVPDDFFLTAQKIAQIFYRVPEVQLSGKKPESEAAAPVFQAVINETLDAEHINAKTTFDEMLTDLISAVGFGACKIGYVAVLDDVPVTDPTTGQPQIDPLTGEPAMQKAMVREFYEGPRIPPGRMLFPPEFTGSDFDKGPYLGFRFIEDVPKGTPFARTSRLTDDEELLSKPTTEGESASRTFILVDAVWYKASLFNPDVKDPEEIWEFEWVVDAPTPRVHRKCPYVNFPGFPVKVLTTRYVSDTCLPPSDTTITRNLVDAQSLGLSTELVHRQRTLPQNLVDTSRLDGDVLAKIEANVLDAFIGIGMPVTEDLVRQLVKGQLPQEHFALQNTLERKTNLAWAMGPNQTGSQSEGSGHTATEMRIAEDNKDTRLDYERNKVVVFFLTKFVRCVAALIQQYAPTDGGYARIVDANGQSILQQWNAQQIQGEFAFTIKINSQLRPDSTADLNRAKDFINFSAKSEYINQAQSWREFVQAYGKDPSRLTTQPKPHTPIAEPAPVSVQDLALAMTNPILAKTLIAWGVPFPPEMQAVIAAMEAQPPAQVLTPGTVDEADVLTKHMDTGELPGGGSMVANGQIHGAPPTALNSPKVM